MRGRAKVQRCGWPGPSSEGREKGVDPRYVLRVGWTRLTGGVGGQAPDPGREGAPDGYEEQRRLHGFWARHTG